MLVIPPTPVTSILSSTIAEPDTTVGEIAWVSAGSYTEGEERIRTTTHKVYTCITTHSGRTALPETDTVYWLETGPTNKWAMFDLYRNTSSIISSGGFSTSVALGKRTDSIAILGANITDITVTVSSVTGGGNIYGPNTFSLVSRDVQDYYDYFYMDFTYKPSILIFDIPPYIDAVITISSTASGSIASVVLGTQEHIGYTLKGHKNDALNFSLITRDSYGNSVLVPRRSVPKTSQNLIIKDTNLAKVLYLRETLNAVPAVWSGLKDTTEGYFESLLILGIYKNLSISIDNEKFINCTLELEEL